MKATLITALASAGLLATGLADPVKEDSAKKPTEAEKAKALVEHQDGSEKLARGRRVKEGFEGWYASAAAMGRADPKRRSCRVLLV